MGFFVSKGFPSTFKWRRLPNGFLGKVPLIWGNDLSRNVQCQGVKGFSLMTLEPKDGGEESRPALRVLQPCSPRCTFGGREGPTWKVGTGHSAPGKTGQREGTKLADLNRPRRILFHPFSLYSRLLSPHLPFSYSLDCNVPQRLTAEGSIPDQGTTKKWWRLY